MNRAARRAFSPQDRLQRGDAMNRLVLIGLIVGALGVLGLLVPVFTTSHTEEVAKVGDVRLTAKDHDTFVVPQAAAIGAIVIGVALMGFGAYRRA
ncbi:MAG TPA: hypothetical protein VL966_01195 [Alphaproteobacteria bacterium]|jgi:multisubunit Na+/H+ antiporter MnhC subunit|nr:hypothetical protein [Alphaproteobacteria bacterium]